MDPPHARQTGEDGSGEARVQDEDAICGLQYVDGWLVVLLLQTRVVRYRL
jgi:hypothetical protein